MKTASPSGHRAAGMLNRRDLIRGGMSVGGFLALPASSLFASRPPETTSMLAIDGLSIAFDVTENTPLEAGILAAIRVSGMTAINMTTPYPGDDFGEAVRKIARLQQIVSEYPAELMIVRTARDIDQCRESGRLGIIIGFQSTEMFDESLAGIPVFHDLGARIVQVSYNGPGLFGHGCLSESPDGLTPTGKQAIEQLNSHHILIDASHANRATTAQAIALSQSPILISHTACNAIYRHPRNNDDTELKALAERGGVAGIYLMPFLDGGSGELTPEMFFLHLEHALQVCGEDHVGIGSDQGIRAVDDGPEYRERLKQEVERRVAAGISAPGESADRPPFIPELNLPERMHRIAGLMEQRGHSGRVINKVIGENFYRVMNQVW